MSILTRGLYLGIGSLLLISTNHLIAQDMGVKNTNSTIVIKKGYENKGFGSGGAQMYLSSNENKCSKFRFLGKFSVFTGADKEKSILSGSRTYFIAYADQMKVVEVIGVGHSSEIRMKRGACSNRIAFTPQPGETYTLVQRSELAGSCTFSAIAKSSGLPPPDLEEAPPCDNSK